MTDSNDFHGLELAIVGMSGRFPGADDVDAFWQNLVDEVDWMTDLSDEEMIEEGADPETLKAPTYVKKARRLAHHDHFDAAFFGISPREAEIIDPQQRIFLECAWSALEDAGYDTARFRGMVGVFAGSRLNGYFRNVYSNPAVLQRVGDLEIQVANDKDYLATRVSYKLDLGGPSVTVQTACSTALVAIHHASQALLNGECSMALAGGVGLRVPETGYVYVPGEVLSPDGRVRAFSKDAGGTMFSSGGGILVLRRLEDAMRDGDRIRAVIKGSAVTNDGAAKVGFTAPGMDGQVRVLRSAMIASEVEPETISYIEAHGTGTQLGDPIEVSALTKLFREFTEKKHFCALGSVKTNIGHMGAASGVASMVKTVMALENQAIPASLHFSEPNPQIDFDDSPFVVNTKLRPWQTNGLPRRAGVSAFGMGGTNAHVVLEEAPPPPAVTPSRDWQMLVLSARTPSALDTQTANLTQHLAAHPDIALPDVAHTLQVGRRGFEHRRVAVVGDRDDALAVLGGDHPERLLSAYLSTPERPVTFMFSGQGAQYAGMTGGLYRTERVFRETVDHCCDLLAKHLDVDLRTLLVLAEDADETTDKAAGERLRQTAITQPALFVVEYAVAQQLMAWGIQPESMIGHSIGEYVAACLAGVFSLEDALALVAARGQLMQKLPSGAMLSVALDETQARAAIADQTDGQDLAVAAINAPGRVVIAGPHAAIEALRVQLTDAGTACQVLHTSHAFHSPMMEPILAPFAERVGAITLSPPKIPFVSNVTGTWIRRQEATDPAYWARHLRSAVRFADGLATLADEAHRCLVEIGPGKTLSMLARQQPDRPTDQPILQTVRHPKAKQDDQAFLLGTLGQAWLAGAVADLRPLWADEKRRRLSLPTYPFERQRFWVKQGNLGQSWATTAQTVKTDIADWFYVPFWKPSVVPDGKLDSEHQATWLLFQDTCGVSQALASHLRAHGQRVIQVDAGTAFADRTLSDHGEAAYTIAPGKREDYTALIAALASNDQRPDHIAHLFSITVPPIVGAPEVPAVDREPEATERGFWSLLYLAQALGTQKLGTKKGGTKKGERTMSMAVVSNNLHAIAGESFLCPEKATLLGPAKILPQEYPHLRTTQVDVVLATDSGGPVAIGAEGDALVDPSMIDPRMIERLVGELLVPSADPMVAYRGDQRWVRGYDAVRIEKTPIERLRIRSGGSYLITGGLGGIGLSFAEALARDHGTSDHGTRDHRIKLALLTLSPLPPRESWPQYLEQRGADRLGRRIQKVLDLEAAGAEVLVVSADVADADPLRAAVEQTVAAFGTIHGVLHAAGLAGGGMIQLKAPAAAARVLAPKVQGTLNLAAALDGIDLDFLALCSSTIAVAGGFGQVDYCAANSFLDAYAHAQQRAGKPVISINWGAWQDVGMAVDSGLMRGASPKTQDEAEGKDQAKPIHPLIDRCVAETAELTVYATDFSPQRHWVLAEHRIMGTPAIPGTTYLEMARAAYAHHGAGFSQHAGLGGIELRDVYFLGPLMIAEGTQREAKILLEPDGDGFSFRITSTGDPGAAGGAPGQAAHARGKVGPLAEDDPADEHRDEHQDAHRVDIDAIRRRCDRERIEIEGDIMATDEGVVRWGPRWQSLKVVHLGTDEALAEIVLPDAFIDELDTFVLHPALLDVATGLVGFMEEGNHLPLSYQRVRVRGPLGGTLFSHVTKLPPVGGGKDDTGKAGPGKAGPGKETVSVNVSLLDADGVEQVRIDRFTMKKVGDAADSLKRSARGVEEPGPANRDVAAVPERPQSPVQARGGGIKPEDGIEALLRVLSKGVHFPQVAISAKDLNALFAEVNAIDRDAIGDQTAAAAPRTTHARPNLPTPFRAPESDTEKQVAEVWQATLGIEEVGVDDNFFDLGGDSIIGIQLISRLSDLGFELSPEQLFEHQTITELARQLDADSSAASATEDAPPGASAAASAATAEDSQSEAAFSDAGLAEDDLAAVLARFEDA